MVIGALDTLTTLAPVLGLSLPDNAHNIGDVFNKRSEDPILISADYIVGKNEPSTTVLDVKFLLEPLVFNGVLRIPRHFPMTHLLGDFNENKSQSLLLVAMLDSGRIVIERKIKNKFLDNELYLANKQGTSFVLLNDSDIYQMQKKHMFNKKGFEVGGPSKGSYRQYYANAEVDLINFKEETLWGTFKNGSPTGRGRGGKILIMDGSYLIGLANNSYDFALGSHYLEHLVNPLQALYAMKRVVKPGGVIHLTLPRKEACFDDLRGIGRVEEIIYRFLHKVNETDMRYCNLDEATMTSNLKRDREAKNYMYFRGRSIRNNLNRGVHQFVYDYDLLMKMGSLLGLQTIFTGSKGVDQHIMFMKGEL